MGYVCPISEHSTIYPSLPAKIHWHIRTVIDGQIKLFKANTQTQYNEYIYSAGNRATIFTKTIIIELTFFIELLSEEYEVSKQEIKKHYEEELQ
jgi:hypothetical protein